MSKSIAEIKKEFEHAAESEWDALCGLYASDERYTVEQPGGEGETSREERETAHILLEDAQGNQSALTITQTQPEVQGVVVVSQFAGNAAIREKLLEAVCTALHVSSAKVCVTAGG